MTNFYFYYACGIDIKSSIYFPELMTGKHNTDIEICYKEFKPPEASSVKLGLNEVSNSPNDVIYLLDNEPLFRVKSGKKILVNPHTHINKVYLRNLILGPGLGTILRQRGCLVLHASAVNINGGAVVFLGRGGEGKSTIAAAMNSKGYEFITDDILIFKFNDHEKPYAIPSFPRVKLWYDVIEYVTKETDSVVKIHPQIEKYSYSVKSSFSLNPIPLKIIYYIEQSDENDITTLKSQEALIKLIKSSFDLNLFGNAGKSQNLLQCANLVKNIPVKRLKKTCSLQELENLIRLVEIDVYRLENK